MIFSLTAAGVQVDTAGLYNCYVSGGLDSLVGETLLRRVLMMFSRRSQDLGPFLIWLRKESSSSTKQQDTCAGAADFHKLCSKEHFTFASG